MHVRIGLRISSFFVLCGAFLVMGLGQIAPAYASTIAYQPDLYQIRSADHSIWQYNGTPNNWTMLDNNPLTDTIAARGTYLYQMHTDRSIWQYVRALHNWLELDTNPTTREIAVGSAGRFYQLHTDGSVWQYDGGGLYSWSELDNNPLTTSIVAGGNELYQMHNSGVDGSGDHTIWQYAGGGFHSWTPIDNNSLSAYVVASDNGTLYQIHNSVHLLSIWRYDGGGITGWVEVESTTNVEDQNFVEAAGTMLYEIESFGPGNSHGLVQNTSGVLGDWTLIDTNKYMCALVASGSDLYEQHSMDYSIWQYNRPLNSWVELDTNPHIGAIAREEAYFIG